MGASGQQRARALYDWKTIIGHYEALWANLSEMRLSQSKDLQPLVHPWPARMDPFHAFASYPTKVITPQTLLALVDTDSKMAIARALSYRQLAMVDFAKFILPTEVEIHAVLSSASSNPQPGQALIFNLEPSRQIFVFRAFAWFLKMGVLCDVSAGEKDMNGQEFSGLQGGL
jgi:hypothetical protein